MTIDTKSLRHSSGVNYLYTVITPETGDRLGLSPQFWLNHPDWRFFVRTNHRVPGRPGVWISGGGATLAEAIGAAEYGLRQLVFQPHPLLPGLVESGELPMALAGAESEVPIMNGGMREVLP